MSGLSDSLKLIFSGMQFRLRQSTLESRSREMRRQAIFTESFMVASLRNQLDNVLQDMAASKEPIDCVVIHIDKEAIKYLTRAAGRLDCTLIPCGTVGTYLLERQEEYL